MKSNNQPLWIRIVRNACGLLLLLSCVLPLRADTEELKLSDKTLITFNPLGCISKITIDNAPILEASFVMAEKKIAEGTITDPKAKSVIHQNWSSVLGDKAQYQVKDSSHEFSGTIIDSKSPGKPRELDYVVTYTKLDENRFRVHATVTPLSDSKWFAKPFYQFSFPFAVYGDGTVVTQTTRGQEEQTRLNTDKLVFKGEYSQVSILNGKRGLILECNDDCVIRLTDTRLWKGKVLSVSVAPKPKGSDDPNASELTEKSEIDVVVTVKTGE
ncbi:MAG: hypothetical protein B9S32_04375 [Verrucomicrobia bacterium Tous-C9LFEB]|nr:MAG: hypothetical protein B9S32_04375 [Verrucomicrobia bacterium Tous-C9LFEB]